jgi:hypothetical protein
VCSLPLQPKLKDLYFLIFSVPSERNLQLSHQRHSGRTTKQHPKRLHETHDQPLRLCQVNSPCYFVWPSITRRHWPPAPPRRTRLLQGGTSFDTLPSKYHGYHPASHCPCLVPTYERNQSPHPRSTFSISCPKIFRSFKGRVS